MAKPKYKFVLDKSQTDTQGYAPVYLQFSHAGIRRKASTIIKIRKADLDTLRRDKAFRVKPQLLKAEAINAELDRVEVLAFEVLAEARGTVTAEALRDAFTTKAGRGQKKQEPEAGAGWPELFDQFLAEKQKTINKATFKHYLVFRGHFETVIQNKALSELSKADMDRFINWSYDTKAHTPAYVKKLLDKFNAFREWLVSNGHPMQEEVIKWKPGRAYNTKPNEAVFLYPDEWLQLYHHTPSSERLERVKDTFLLHTHTGLRHSDQYIDETELRSDRIVRHMEKTERDAIIPITKFARSILQKYDNNLPYIASQNFNNYLKELGKEAGLNRKVKRIRWPGGKKVVEVFELWELMSSKMCRTTLISKLVANNAPNPYIQKITGHSKPINLEPYKSIDPNAAANLTRDILDSDIPD